MVSTGAIAELLRDQNAVREASDAYEDAARLRYALGSREEHDDLTGTEIDTLTAPNRLLHARAAEICADSRVPILARAAVASVAYTDNEIRPFTSFRDVVRAVTRRENRLHTIEGQLAQAGLPILVLNPAEGPSPYYALVSGSGDGLARGIRDKVVDGEHHMVATFGISRVRRSGLVFPGGIDLERGVVSAPVAALARAAESGPSETARRMFDQPRLPGELVREYFFGEGQIDRLFVLGRDLENTGAKELNSIQGSLVHGGYIPSFAQPQS